MKEVMKDEANCETIPGAPDPHPKQRTLTARIVTIVGILVPLVGVIAAPIMVWGWGFHWTDLGLLLGMYTVTVLGITIGFHRLFVHRSFDTYAWMKFIWAVLGSMAVQGTLFWWVARHRAHHQHADTLEDPHSPQHSGGGVLGLIKGFWHAHIGWIFDPAAPVIDRYIKDLKASRALLIASKLFPLWVALGLLIPALLGAAITQSWPGFWRGLIWGGLVRIFLVHHITWSVNSACHLWGRQPYRSADESRDNFLFGILALGEGWHNTHHAFPSSARHGLRWWQLDLSYWIIRTLAFLHLAWNLKLPSKEAQFERRSAAH